MGLLYGEGCSPRGGEPVAGYHCTGFQNTKFTVLQVVNDHLTGELLDDGKVKVCRWDLQWNVCGALVREECECTNCGYSWLHNICHKKQKHLVFGQKFAIDPVEYQIRPCTFVFYDDKSFWFLFIFLLWFVKIQIEVLINSKEDKEGKN